MQFLTEAEHQEMVVDPEVINNQTIVPLLVVYIMVPPVAKTQDPIIPVRYAVFGVDSTNISDDLAKEKQWLEHMQTLLKDQPE